MANFRGKRINEEVRKEDLSKFKDEVENVIKELEELNKELSWGEFNG